MKRGNQIFDRYLFFTVLVISGLGMVMLYSASSAIGTEKGDDAVFLNDSS